MKSPLGVHCTTNQARIFTALFLTGILSVGSGFSLIKSSTAASVELAPETTNQVLKGNLKQNQLPRPIVNVVLQDLSKRTGIYRNKLQIINYSQQNWRNGCLELAQPDEFCTQAIVPGWRFVVSDGRQNWVYHTNNNGRSIRLASANTPTNNSTNQLPQSVRNVVLQAASKRLQQPISQLNIIQAQQQTWPDGCLGLANPNEGCTLAMVPGWRVVVAEVGQTLVYHTNNNGRYIRFASANTPTNNSTTQLPQSVKNSVLQVASKRLQQPISQLNIIQAQQQTWSDGCLGLGKPYEGCIRAVVPGWRVVVTAVGQTLVYHTDQTGSAVRLNENSSQITSQQLPQKVRDAVLREASQVSGLPVSALNIVAYKQKKFAQGCERPTFPNACDQILVSGWEVFVKSANRISPWVFLSDDSGSQIKLASDNRPNTNAGKIAPVTIPSNELPQPLDRNVVFRQISSGGLAGSTYETVLLNDGSLIRVKIGDANDSDRRVRRVSPQQVQQFQQLLANTKFAEFKNLSYPAPSGAADYITYTLTSPEGTVRYNNISQNQLPSNLRNVVKAWNRLRNSPIADNSTDGAVPIPANEMPLPLDRDMVFRQISSGGFIGRTYETVLLKDGTLIRVRIGDANDSERSVRRISSQQVQQFQKLVERSQFAEFKNLSYPAPSGAADYITYTLTSKEGTVRYNDISQKNLPNNLQQVVKAWNQIGSSAQ
jgi:hypothetical protein